MTIRQEVSTEEKRVEEEQTESDKEKNQDSKADVKWRYTPTQFANLQRMGKIPEILEIQ